MNKVLQLLTLNYEPLKGKRTIIGVLTYLASDPEVMATFLSSGFCADHGVVCILLKTLSVWFLAMGVRGK